jgi:hypothetical protein
VSHHFPFHTRVTQYRFGGDSDLQFRTIRSANMQGQSGSFHCLPFVALGATQFFPASILRGNRRQVISNKRHLIMKNKSGSIGSRTDLHSSLVTKFVLMRSRKGATPYFQSGLFDMNELRFAFITHRAPLQAIVPTGFKFLINST